MKFLLALILMISNQVFAGEIVSEGETHTITESVILEHNWFFFSVSDAKHKRDVMRFTKKSAKPQMREFCQEINGGKAKIISSRYEPGQCIQSATQAICGGTAQYKFLCVE